MTDLFIRNTHIVLKFAVIGRSCEKFFGYLHCRCIALQCLVKFIHFLFRRAEFCECECIFTLEHPVHIGHFMNNRTLFNQICFCRYTAKSCACIRLLKNSLCSLPNTGLLKFFALTCPQLILEKCRLKLFLQKIHNQSFFRKSSDSKYSNANIL